MNKKQIETVKTSAVEKLSALSANNFEAFSSMDLEEVAQLIVDAKTETPIEQRAGNELLDGASAVYKKLEFETRMAKAKARQEYSFWFTSVQTNAHRAAMSLKELKAAASNTHPPVLRDMPEPFPRGWLGTASDKELKRKQAELSHTLQFSLSNRTNTATLSNLQSIGLPELKPLVQIWQQFENNAERVVVKKKAQLADVEAEIAARAAQKRKREQAAEHIDEIVERLEKLESAAKQ